MSYNEAIREQKQKNSSTQRSNGKPSQGDKFVYINLSATKEQKAKIKTWSDSLTLVVDALNHVVSGRCNLSVKFSEYHNCFVCSLTDLHPLSNNRNVVVSSYAGKPENALFTTLWFVFENWANLEQWPADKLTDPDW